jgi:hypothetical protein
VSTPRRNSSLFLALLFVVGGIAYGFGGFEWLDFVAVAGTAVGTLGLAFYTYDLASATRTAEAQTEELVKAGHAQASAAREQITISERQLSIAQVTATEVARARIDAAAPLVAMAVYDTGFWVSSVKELGEEEWTESELRNAEIETGIGFTLTNHGASPALVAFPSWALGEPEKLLVRSRGSRQIVLEPGETYVDRVRLRIRGMKLVAPMWCEVVYTYSSFLQGAVFDTVRWNGWLQLMQLVGGTARRNQQIPLNAGPAQIVREYPALERPEEMQELRERIRTGRRPEAEKAE